MTEECTRSFDEEQLSGYLDNALPQVQAQRVRLHLEVCHVCQALHKELKTLRETAMATRFNSPEEEEWPELPRTRASFVSRSLGWTMLVAWAILVTGIALYRFLSQTGDPLEVFLILGLPGGFVLLFLSVLLDRLRDLKMDRYRGVHR